VRVKINYNADGRRRRPKQFAEKNLIGYVHINSNKYFCILCKLYEIEKKSNELVHVKKCVVSTKKNF